MNTRATWFAQCECPGDTFSTNAKIGPSCKSCGSPWIRVPHVVEDRIRVDERRRFLERAGVAVPQKKND